ncbi:methyl-accepting chemotaxis protein [Geobacter sp. DSM 9736]|uniref:methyl-accepting chemotaxis protein n=1 Tax=Geobacter sp. DSM 9736 TaxID=1277350 RepID=UPI000B50BE8E|nr:methyl-accepting chemotaxis protein [Geobacter sp. DSM 9736]SNB47072.1 methyl-accepting chemotaxis sensory transducer with Cache sensor [Geobacter sp. DSM 9736]
MKIRRFRNWGILQKIMSTTLISVLLIVAAAMFYLLPLVEKYLMEEKKQATQQVVEVAYHIIQDYGEKVKTGVLTLEQAQQAAAADIKDLRYKRNEYFWINDLAPRMIMHPTKPELDGKDLNTNKDPQGKYLFREFVKVCEAKGEGFVDYMWPKPGENAPVDKISYVKLYRPWGWIIGSGIYVDDVHAGVARLRWGIVLATLLLGAVSLLLAFSVSLGITRPLKRVRDNLHEIAAGEGDLTRRIPIDRDDEAGDLAHSFNTFVEKLQVIISQVAENAQEVASAAGKVQAVSQDMASGTATVAEQATTVATATEEMAATYGEVAQNCMMAAESSQKANEKAVSGTAVVEETVRVMSRIAARVKESAQTVEQLGARSDEIGKIIGTIEDIADQTNLLALNAAIEAARAGEQGRGFAVVADEVRALAERTTKATREIGEMIKAIQQETKGAVASMDEGVREVEKGTGDAAKSGEALQEILDQINSVTMEINQIATAAEQQTATTAEISQNVQRISEVVSETSRGAKDSAQAAERLAGLASELQRLVGRFKLAA